MKRLPHYEMELMVIVFFVTLIATATGLFYMYLLSQLTMLGIH